MGALFQNELKKEFQLERMILFSDAVFAIAITLLVIEIKVPEVAKNLLTAETLAHKTAELIPKFIGFVVSFFVIGIYWVVHHRTFGYVVNYDQRLLWLNLFFLFAVVLMPFSSGFYSEYVLRHLTLPVVFYVCNIVFLGIMSLILWNYVASPKRKLSEGITPDMRRYFRIRAVVPPVVFILMAIIYLFVNPAYAPLGPALIPLFMRMARKQYLKPSSKPKSAR